MGEWISVYERLPGTSHEVLAHCDATRITLTAYFRPATGDWYAYPSSTPLAGVTHWMPKPDDPPWKLRNVEVTQDGRV
jgi:hypothetical protein